MNLGIYAIFDSKAECFRFPAFCRTKGEMVREFASAANRKDSEIGKYPGDFSLYECGVFDDQTGMVSALRAPVNLGIALSYKEDGGVYPLAGPLSSDEVKKEAEDA